MPAEPDPAAPAGRKPIAAAFATALLVAAWLGSLFAAAGTIAWPTGWIYVAVVAGGLAAHRAYVARRCPALFARRAWVGVGTPRWDVVWVTVFWPLMLATPIVAAVETQRLGRPELPPWSAATGTLLFVAGMVLSARAMVANPFFEGTARLQHDQRVVDTGPYASLRHPGYAALILWSVSTPLLLRSRTALAPALACAGWVVVRTALEDRMLRAGLAGYAAYARRVRWRLVPRVW